MEPNTWFTLGGYVLGLAALLVGMRKDRRTADQGDRTVGVAEDNVSLAQLTAANAALDHRVEDLEGRLDVAEKDILSCAAEKLAIAGQRDRLWALLVRNGIDPT